MRNYEKVINDFFKDLNSDMTMDDIEKKYMHQKIDDNVRDSLYFFIFLHSKHPVIFTEFMTKDENVSFIVELMRRSFLAGKQLCDLESKGILQKKPSTK
jgi:hypothetical protein